MQLRRLAIALSVIAVLVGIGVGFWFDAATRADARRGWTVIRQLENSDELTTTVVEVQPEVAKERSVYDAAVKMLCSIRRHGNVCTVGFFLPGDESPITGSVPKWGDFNALAIWSNDSSGKKEFTFWDCSRAGAERSPPSALCGVAVKEAHQAAASLGLRQGTGEFCNWPPRNDIPASLSVILSEMAKYDRSAQVKLAYTQMVEVGRDTRANHGYDCNAFHATLDAMVDEALFNYRAAMEHASDYGR